MGPRVRYTWCGHGLIFIFKFQLFVRVLGVSLFTSHVIVKIVIVSIKKVSYQFCRKWFIRE